MSHPNIGFEVIVIGNAGIDTNIYLPGSEIDFSVEANFTENIDYVGQAGGYASRGFAQLGYRTAYIGALGKDFQGEYVYQELSNDEINLAGIFEDPRGTARSVNFMYPDGRRKNFYDGKSHMELTADMDICSGLMVGSRLAHFNIPNWARKLLPVAREAGLVISCDIQDITDIGDRYRFDFIQQADILFFSAVNFDNVHFLMENFLGSNPQQLLIAGMGALGCAVGTSGGVRFYAPVDLDLPIVDTNGAGDALAVGFLSSYILEHYSLENSILRGQIAARYTCSIKASTSNLITRTHLDTYYAKLTGSE
jgi:sugar/nucleoside kinase (ribokinase family)